MRRALTIALFSTVAANWSHAQSSAIFEAAIIRQSGPKSAFQAKLTPSEFIATRHTLQMLIESSYPDLPPWRISGGPPWSTTDQWDLIAKLPARSPTDQEHLYRATEQMLRNFLAEEFKLKTRFAQKERPVYYLVLAKDALKLKASQGGEASFRFTASGIEIRHETIQEFARALYCPNCDRQLADRPAFDKTGLNGYYDLTLNWSPSNIQNDNSASGPSIFTALQEQLGLKLQPGKAMIDFLIIDGAERPPQN